MARPVKWWSILVSLAILLNFYSAQAQIILQDSVKTPQRINAYSADRTGNIYIGQEGGSILKYDVNLDSVVAYNPTRVGNFELIEAWHGFQVFAFNRKFQDFVLLDRFLSRESRYSLGNTGLFFTAMATLASDQNLWLLEENSLRLMKFDFRTNETILEVSLDPWLEKTDHNFGFLREYQNVLFLTDANSGTYIFDNLGNFIKKLNTGQSNYLSFSGENFFYLDRNKLVKKNLYSEHSRVYDLPATTYLGILIYGDFVYLLGERTITQAILPKN